MLKQKKLHNKKKIAFISGWYVETGMADNTDQNINTLIDALYISAKKFFLPNHDVDFIFLTNSNINIDNVINIKINYNVDNFWHICLLKILSIKYITKEYDYIYVNDTDQIYIDYVNDEILDNDFVILEHFLKYKVKDVHGKITKIVPLNFNINEPEWTMGNFFGGKASIINDLVDKALYWHDTYKVLDSGLDIGFYAMYPEELFLIKFIFEYKIKYKILCSSVNPTIKDKKCFLSDFNDNLEIYEDITNIKLLHNTKKNPEVLKKIIKKIIQ